MVLEKAPWLNKSEKKGQRLRHSGCIPFQIFPGENVRRVGDIFTRLHASSCGGRERQCVIQLFTCRAQGHSILVCRMIIPDVFPGQRLCDWEQVQTFPSQSGLSPHSGSTHLSSHLSPHLRGSAGPRATSRPGQEEHKAGTLVQKSFA